MLEKLGYEVLQHWFVCVGMTTT